MTIMTKLLAGAAGLSALAVAAPASAQYYNYPYSSYGYANRYDSNPYVRGTQYGYANSYDRNPYVRGTQYGYANTSAAAQQCSAAVQARLNNRTSLGEILGAALGVSNATGRVLSITRVDPNRNTIRVRGLASSGRMAYNNYGPYGAGAYGALGYGYANAADLNFRCDVDYRGYVRDVRITRR